MLHVEEELEEDIGHQGLTARCSHLRAGTAAIEHVIDSFELIGHGSHRLALVVVGIREDGIDIAVEVTLPQVGIEHVREGLSELHVESELLTALDEFLPQSDGKDTELIEELGMGHRVGVRLLLYPCILRFLGEAEPELVYLQLGHFRQMQEIPSFNFLYFCLHTLYRLFVFSNIKITCAL